MRYMPCTSYNSQSTAQKIHRARKSTGMLNLFVWCII
nr:MAG TPA: hypothetical protein [Caudoviricetes sp.]